MTQRPVLLLTRPKAASERTWQDLVDQGLTGVDPCIAPLFEIVPKGPLPDLASYDGLIFTSANGVKAYTALGGPAEGLAYTVGPQTDLAAQTAGLHTRCADGNADDLVTLILSDAPSGRWLHIHGTNARGDIAGRLTANGVTTDSVVLYDQVAQPLSTQAERFLSGPAPIILPLFSPRTARLFAIAKKPSAPLYIGCMSEAVKDRLGECPSKMCLIARQPNFSAMCALVSQLTDLALSNEG